ncbi:MAG TPA: dTMP kinase [Candidatus Limnocylindria bacterium]|jgi:dTMP kinase|nr:dTMP kinase [Candidatus Limnocylindria bacterium]
MPRGWLVTFEGVEACGKSTQVRLLAEWFRGKGRTVRELREPGGTPLGEKLRDLVKHDPAGVGMAHETELLLMNASRAELVRRVIRPALENGEVVLCDRFFDSTLAYQGWGRQMDAAMVKAVVDVAVGVTRPDLTFLIQVSPEISALRLASRQAAEKKPALDRFEVEKQAFYERVREGYRWLVQNEPQRVVEIDGNGLPEAIHSELVAVVTRRLA